VGAVQSAATSVKEYLDELPPDRREAIEEVRRVVLDNLPPGFEEIVDFGMLVYAIPLERYPDTYNGHPLGVAALASQKNYMSLYLGALYGGEESRSRFEKEYRATGKRFDVGKGCVRFRRVDDLPLDLVARAVAAVDVETLIELDEQAHPRSKKRR
jgi:hypothetical protein